MILDVGCGSFPSGDVNCDLFITDVGHRNQKGRVLDVHKVKHFVLCDAENLPFRDEIFEKVVCDNVIEHLKNPLKCLNELLRVSKRDILIIVPHWLGEMFVHRKRWKFHLSTFRCRWFITFADKNNLFHKVAVTRWLCNWFGLLFCIPSEITVKLRKLEK